MFSTQFSNWIDWPSIVHFFDNWNLAFICKPDWRDYNQCLVLFRYDKKNGAFHWNKYNLVWRSKLKYFWLTGWLQNAILFSVCFNVIYHKQALCTGHQTQGPQLLGLSLVIRGNTDFWLVRIGPNLLDWTSPTFWENIIKVWQLLKVSPFTDLNIIKV